MTRIEYVAAGLGWLAMLASPIAVTGSPPVKPSETTRDVVLADRGTLTGRVLDAQRRPAARVVVSVTRGRMLVTQAVTDRQGLFRLTGLVTGLHVIRCGDDRVVCRLWSAATAPPAAASSLELVTRPTTVRGQNGAIERFGLDGVGGLDPYQLTILTCAIAALTLSAVTLSKVNDIESNVDQLSASP